MLDITKKEVRSPRSFTLLPTTVARVEELAKAYDTNASRIVEALITQYGPKLLEQVKKKSDASA